MATGEPDLAGAPEIVRHPVPAALADVVARISGYRESGRGLTGETEAASLVAPLVISFGGPFEIGLGRAPGPADRYRSFAAGLHGGPVRMASGGDAHCLQIDFTPLGARRFFRLPMRHLADRMVPVDELDDPDLAAFGERLGERPTWASRFALAEDFVAARTGRAGRLSPAVVWAYRQIVASGGTVPVARLAERVEWSRKHLAGRFREEVGLAPKAVARIARFNRAMATARREPDTGWAAIAAACGYADQAHLVREFAILAGATPGAWRATRG